MKLLFCVGCLAMLCSCMHRECIQLPVTSGKTALDLIERGESYSEEMRLYAKRVKEAGGTKKPPVFSRLREFRCLSKEEMVLYLIYVLSDPTLDGERATAAQRLVSSFEEAHQESILLNLKRVHRETVSAMIEQGNGSVADLNSNLERLIFPQKSAKY